MKKNNPLLKILFYLFISITSLSSYSQEDLSNIDTKTYKLFQNKNWPKLIEVGNNELKEGYDYFYLRLRIGIAYYEQQNYRLAETHFRKAIGFNSTDNLANEYLYYCYIFTGKVEEARKLSLSFTPELKTKLKIEEASAIDFILVEGGAKVPEKVLYPTTTSNYAATATYAQVGLKHTISNNFSLFHAASLFKQDTYTGNINQLQYYIQGAIPLKNNWLIAPAMHFVQLKFTSTISTSFNKSYFVPSLTVRKSIADFDFSIGTTISNFTDAKQYNHFGSISYSPFGNSKLIVGFTEYIFTDDQYATISPSFSPFVYFQPFQSVSINLSYLNNKSLNLIENNGAFVNNSFDLTQSRYTALADFRINKTVSVYALYQIEKKLELTENFNFTNNLFLAGIRINP